MSVRRVNSTGRKKILREDAVVFLRHDSDGILSFDAELNLGDYDLSQDANVFVEAYRQTTFMRFDHGTVTSPHPAEGTCRQLTEFQVGDALHFRVKVTSATGRPGLLLAEADRISPRDDQERPDQRIPLLPPFGTDLGDEAWRVDFSDVAGPLLLINDRMGDWKRIASLPLFRGLVYPAAMREVLTYILCIEGEYDRGDGDSWQSRWINFAEQLGVGDAPGSEDPNEDKLKWIDNSVEIFSRRHQMLSRVITLCDEETSG